MYAGAHGVPGVSIIFDVLALAPKETDALVRILFIACILNDKTIVPGY